MENLFAVDGGLTLGQARSLTYSGGIAEFRLELD